MDYKTSTRPEELLKRFQPRFRRIEWHVTGMHSYTHNGPRELCGLRAVHIGEKGAASYTCGGPKFDIRRHGVSIPFTFDPQGKENLESQLWATIRTYVAEGPLKNRRFFVDLVPQDKPLFPDWFCFGSGAVNAHVQFSLEGEAIPGLDLSEQFKVGDWRFFFPSSPEREAVRIALYIEACRHAGRSSDGRELEQQLKELIDSIPA